MSETIEELASIAHDAYLTTCDRLGWEVKDENRVRYDALSENAKELDRAMVRAVLQATQLQAEREMADRLAAAAVQPGTVPGNAVGFWCWLCGCFWQREDSERHHDGCPIPAYHAMREGQRGDAEERGMRR